VSRVLCAKTCAPKSSEKICVREFFQPRSGQAG
jgi:hypothetical protein